MLFALSRKTKKIWGSLLGLKTNYRYRYRDRYRDRFHNDISGIDTDTDLS